jgi:hypothetical protein
MGIVNGYNDNTFRPNNLINRAEFAKIIIATFYDSEQIDNCDVNTIPFTDVVQEEWYAPYICVGYQEGFIQGYGDTNLFKPANNLNYVEALKLIYLANSDQGISMDENVEWYLPYLKAAKEDSIHLSEFGNNLEQQISREEMAELMDRYFHVDYQSNL